ncbi:hypothetical protein [Streptomyces sp. NPDC101181]|uniref:hypothetical protein n=1 Tax=Streptomyces sp. NPDC101181 TaxID=3366125 RepID=UPI003815B360
MNGEDDIGQGAQNASLPTPRVQNADNEEPALRSMAMLLSSAENLVVVAGLSGQLAAPVGKQHVDALRRGHRGRGRRGPHHPGNFVHADATGAVVIPAASLNRVIEKAASIDAEDARFAQTIREETLPS